HAAEANRRSCPGAQLAPWSRGMPSRAVSAAGHAGVGLGKRLETLGGNRRATARATAVGTGAVAFDRALRSGEGVSRTLEQDAGRVAVLLDDRRVGQEGVVLVLDALQVGRRGRELGVESRADRLVGGVGGGLGCV